MLDIVRKKNWKIKYGDYTYAGRGRVLPEGHCQARNSYRICKDYEIAVNIMLLHGLKLAAICRTYDV